MNKIIQRYLKEIGRRGGQSTSPAKQAASRRNGKKGGRPRTQTACIYGVYKSGLDGKPAQIFMK